MTSSSRPPAGLEFKGAAPALAPRPGTPAPDAGTVAPEGIVEMIAAVTGIRDDVADIIVPGAFTRSLRERRPKVCQGHQWDQPIGRLLDVKELMPGDPRLPRTTGDGRPWPAEAGALLCTAQLHMATKAGRDAFEIIRFFGPSEAAFSIGYKVTPGGAQSRRGIRYITDLDLYEVSPVLHGANRYAGLLSVKSSRPTTLERKAATGAVAGRRRDGTPVVVDCSMCGRPAAAVLPGGLGPDESVICAACMDGATDAVTADQAGAPAATISADDLMGVALLELPELTSEEEYAAALATEQLYELDQDGMLTEVDGDQAGTEGYAWRRSDRGTGWGTP